MRAIFLLCAVISLCLYSPLVHAQDLDQDNPIYRELSEQGRMTTGQIIQIWGVPCVEVKLRSGETIRSFVLSIPSLRPKAIMIQDRIALINKTHYLLVINGTGNVSTDKDRIFVPLDYSIEPRILPDYLSAAAKHDKFILIDRKKQYLGLYEHGYLKHVFPISSGASNSTPARDFVIGQMDEVHNSSIYEQAPMDHALGIGGDYFIHEGIVPGYPASHGCIRLFPFDARYLFYQWGKVGIPGKIVG